MGGPFLFQLLTSSPFMWLLALSGLVSGLLLETAQGFVAALTGSHACVFRSQGLCTAPTLSAYRSSSSHPCGCPGWDAVFWSRSSQVSLAVGTNVKPVTKAWPHSDPGGDSRRAGSTKKAAGLCLLACVA